MLKGDLGFTNTLFSPNNLLSIKKDISGNAFDIDQARVRHMILHVIVAKLMHRHYCIDITFTTAFLRLAPI